ncbi:glycogen phosphorylase [Candidatus Scalindua japonica]|uniref:glycogen phosphorylase n=1 Tax=Candidatus Scalindua japonica TaxID=1284222 RepID=A0A286U4E9_9BACT|nr:alpha-glucan family phosphorylase [Candidatus Scalindua japonica]GAX63028.1 glycogen phosphorylase [Candidatus Scalindua japonica]
MNGKIAYFSMEIALKSGMPTYSGGLGVLAGDTIRSASDLKIPLVAVSLLYRKGYFYQRLDSSGWQTEEPVEWVVEDFLVEMAERVTVTIEGRMVYLRAWKYDMKGINDFTVPVYFLDTDLEENSQWDRNLTDFLYGGDDHYRICQEVILGIGGVKMLRSLGYHDIERFHMNEGHPSLLTLELLDEEANKAGRTSIITEDVEAVRKSCVFTTHTPVSAGHDRFAMDLVTRVLGNREVLDMKDVFCCGGLLNMTYLALNLSHYVNGVAKKHGEVSRHMFTNYIIDSITNGVHAETWTSQPIQDLFDCYIPGWREDNASLRYALNIPKDELSVAHAKAKRLLIQYVNHQTNAGMDEDIFTIGFARRAAAYKRGDLLFQDLERLREISSQVGLFQVIYSGKAHPKDVGGKELIKRIHQLKSMLKGDIRIAYIPNYNMELGKMITSGVDLWLNTPQPPLEASGTSGMKAALNGVPSLSILDGWWLEGYIKDVTGWSIDSNDQDMDGVSDRSKDALSLYNKLSEIIPLFYRKQKHYVDIMKNCIAINGSFFNTQRMLQQYIVKAYFL